MPRLRIDNVRLSFPELWEPTAMKAGDKPACSATGLLPPDHPAIPQIEAAMLAAAVEKWKDKGKAMLEALRKTDKLCIHDGTLKAAKYDGYAGMLYINARSETPPKVKDRDPSVDLTKASGRPYSGCYVNLIVDIYAQDNGYGQRINATLKGVQFWADGEAFAGGAPASDDEFAQIEGGGATDSDFFGTSPQ